jgi:hypothetical protein
MDSGLLLRSSCSRLVEISVSCAERLRSRAGKYRRLSNTRRSPAVQSNDRHGNEQTTRHQARKLPKIYHSARRHQTPRQMRSVLATAARQLRRTPFLFTRCYLIIVQYVDHPRRYLSSPRLRFYTPFHCTMVSNDGNYIAIPV